jgi:hypothetical protein
MPQKAAIKAKKATAHMRRLPPKLKRGNKNNPMIAAVSTSVRIIIFFRRVFTI